MPGERAVLPPGGLSSATAGHHHDHDDRHHGFRAVANLKGATSHVG